MFQLEWIRDTLYISLTLLDLTAVLLLPQEHQTCAAAAWHFSGKASSGQRLSPSQSSWRAVALCHPEKTTAEQWFHPLYLDKEEQELPYICFRRSDLLLSGLVGHFDIGETLSTACRVSHTCDLQQAFPLHGRNKGSGCVPRSCPHLECFRQHQCGVNLKSFIRDLTSGTFGFNIGIIIMKNWIPHHQSSFESPLHSPPLVQRRTSRRILHPKGVKWLVLRLFHSTI